MLCFLFCLIQPPDSHTRLMAPLQSITDSMKASKWIQLTPQLLLRQTDRDTGQRDSAFGCVSQAFRKKLPCVLLLEIFALGRWLLTGGHSVSLGVQDDDKQMVCCDLCPGCWCGDTMALMEHDRRR